LEEVLPSTQAHLGRDLTNLSAYDYLLPEELIAQYPLPRRDSSRLMVVERSSGNISEMPFSDIYHLLQRGDSLVFNDTKVNPSRLHGIRKSGGKTEIVLVKKISEDTWDVLGKPAKKLKIGTRIQFSETFFCTVVETLNQGLVRVQFDDCKNFERNVSQLGQLPLPPYIHRNTELLDEERYQTVYAEHPGAVAAPTAGLHFSSELLQNLEKKGVGQCKLTLHVGMGTFQPVLFEDVREHHMHAESYHLSEEAAKHLNARCTHRKQICVGTTCCRTLESVADNQGKITAGRGTTDLFIYPGYQFKYVQSLLTNFHYPRSTLLMLVCAFAGYELTMEAYKKAVKERFRFFSYGDAMLVL